MKILESDRGWTVETWVVECRGKRYACETHGRPANNSQCRELE